MNQCSNSVYSNNIAEILLTMLRNKNSQKTIALTKNLGYNTEQNKSIIYSSGLTEIHILESLNPLLPLPTYKHNVEIQSYYNKTVPFLLF